MTWINDLPILTIMLAVPLLFAVAILCLPAGSKNAPRWLALAGGGFLFLLSTIVKTPLSFSSAGLSCWRFSPMKAFNCCDTPEILAQIWSRAAL